MVRFDWANPHSYIYVKAPDANGAAVEWEIETQSTPGLVRLGWTPNSLKSGDHVTVRARPHRDPSLHSAFAQGFIKEDGTILASIFGASRASPDSAPHSAKPMGRLARGAGRVAEVSVDA